MNCTIRHIFFLLLIISSLFSCKKDDPTPIEKLEMGDTKNSVDEDAIDLVRNGLLVKKYDLLLELVAGPLVTNPRNNTPFDVDLNNDGINDLQLTFSAPASVFRAEPLFTCKLLCSKDLKVIAYSIIDTIFIDTSISGPLPGTYDSTQYTNNIYIKKLCKRIYKNQKFESIQHRNVIKQLNEGGEINLNNPTVSGEINLTHQGNLYLEVDSKKISDTLERILERNESCYTLPFNKEIYLGLIMNNTKLGWIKLEAINYNRMKLIETAIAY